MRDTVSDWSEISTNCFTGTGPQSNSDTTSSNQSEILSDPANEAPVVMFMAGFLSWYNERVASLLIHSEVANDSLTLSEEIGDELDKLI